MDDSKYTFSRGERNGILLLVLMIIFGIFAKSYIIQLFEKESTVSAQEKENIIALQNQIAEAKDRSNTASYSPKYNTSTYSESKTNNVPAAVNEHKPFTLEVNSATAEEYEKLYGIGKVLSVRIVTFRDKLGGFYSVNQVKDVFGVEDSVFQHFKSHLTIKPKVPKKININSATYEELTANPYFFSTVAKQIIGYRTKVKPFTTIEDVKNLYFVRDHPEHFDKMKPYIEI
ncbi:MAG TPA: helix-hairpin-helix domain-containing protein [Chitinophagales bacterium]|nr:helix-hairpin-helix domain-containing protein [Chitinophagales bacterium]HNL84216.1 helix-hairpin-helix domain-containing protein [Chitinophagales bacterium]